MEPIAEQERFIIRSSIEVPSEKLDAFFKEMYLDRNCDIRRYWKWFCRLECHNNKGPLVITDGDKIIAHAGIIPFEMRLDDGLIKNAAWFIDFAILPDYQKRGLGIKLTKKWMELSDVYVTFCNEKSMGIFKKYGWIESFDTRLHHVIINPLKYPKIWNKLESRMPNFVLNALGTCLVTVAVIYYRRFARSLNELQFEAVTRSSIQKFQVFLKTDGEVTTAVRDSKYLFWRFLESPDVGEYSIVSLNDTCKFLIKPRRDKMGSPHLDVLVSTELEDEADIKQLLATLAIWCKHEELAYIRYYCSNSDVSRSVQRSLISVVRNPRFGFYSKDENIFQKLQKTRWMWDLLDSDFEITG
jgi:hypothetical protein